MKGTLARDGDHKREEWARLVVDSERGRVAQPSAAAELCGFGIVVRLSDLSVRLTNPRSQEWLCHSITCSRKLYLLGGVCVLSTTFSWNSFISE